MSGWSQAGSASGHRAGGLSGRSGALGGGVGSVQGQGRGAAALDMDREILEPQGRGPLTNVHLEPGEKTLGKPGVGK